MMEDHKIKTVENRAAQEDAMKSIMYREAKERMGIFQVSADDIDRFLAEKEIPKVVVDHKNRRICKQALTEEEKEMIGQLEKGKEYLVYYLIQDEGIWPDGCSFPRYTLLYVDKYKEEYLQIKKYIQMYEIVPAYVVNQEEPECSESTEIGFRNVSGLIMNVT